MNEQNQNLLCACCDRPLLGFTPKKPTKKNKGYCVRKDCLRARKRRKREEEESERAIDRYNSGEVPEGEVLPSVEEEKEKQEKDREEKKDDRDEDPDHPTESDLEDAAPVRVEDGHAYEEKPRVQGDGLISVASDLDDEPRLARIRAGKPVPAFPPSVYVPKREQSEEHVPVVDIERIRKAEAVLNRLKGEDGKRFDLANMPIKEEATVEKITPEMIRNQWQTELDQQRQEAEEQGRLFISGVKASAISEPDKANLRLACRKSTRELADLLNKEEFRQPIETPSKAGLKSRTLKIKTALTPEETTFYKHYASNNFTVAEMIEKYGVWTDDDIRELENRIITHATNVGLLSWASIDLGESERNRDYEMENRLIEKTKGGLIGGGIHRGKLGARGQPLKLNSFRTPPTRMGFGWDSDSDGGGSAEDAYDEESEV